MPKGKPTTTFQRGEVVALHKVNLSCRDISKMLKMPKSTVHDIIKKYIKNKSVKDKPRPGRPKLSTPRADRSLVLKSLRDRKTTAPLLKNMWERRR